MLVQVTSLAILTSVLFLQLISFFYRKRGKGLNLSLNLYPKILFFVAIGLTFTYYLFLTYTQYTTWKESGPPTKYLVPPYKSLSYVIGYHFIRFALYYSISLFMAILFLLAANFLNTRYGKRFFESEEPYLGALSVFLLGNPTWRYAWIYYFAALLVCSLVGSLILSYWLKKDERFSLYWLWLPTAILVILITSLS